MACMVADMVVDMADTMGGGELMNHDPWIVVFFGLVLASNTRAIFTKPNIEGFPSISVNGVVMLKLKRHGLEEIVIHTSFNYWICRTVFIQCCFCCCNVWFDLVWQF